MTALMTIFAYLLGSLSSAVIVSKKLAMPDPRGYGSGNLGATNVLRSAVWPAGSCCPTALWPAPPLRS